MVRTGLDRKATGGEPMATKKCPFCAEEIQEEAVVCKHCGRDLVEQPKEEKKSSAGRFQLYHCWNQSTSLPELRNSAEQMVI